MLKFQDFDQFPHSLPNFNILIDHCLFTPISTFWSIWRLALQFQHFDQFPTFFVLKCSGIARAFPGGRLAHLEGQNEEENEWSLRKNKKNCSKFEKKMRKVELSPTRDCDAGYGPCSNVNILINSLLSIKFQHFDWFPLLQ